jgi:indole-3-glycerol phosphate synthase
VNILNKIIDDVRQVIDERSRKEPISQLEEKAMARISGLSEKRLFQALRKHRISIIAEVKRASPSRGIICHDFDPLAIAQDYQAGGASAISVLTEEKHFLGSLSYLREIAKQVNLPLLRKDFIIDEYQIYEAAANSASAVLLIAAILSTEQIEEFSALSHSLKMDALVEVHDEEELHKALKANAEIVGVNNRNLKTFDVKLQRSLDLAKCIPPDLLKVSESGIRSRKDIETLAEAGFDAVLIGENLIARKDRVAFLRELRGETCG